MLIYLKKNVDVIKFFLNNLTPYIALNATKTKY